MTKEARHVDLDLPLVDMPRLDEIRPAIFAKALRKERDATGMSRLALGKRAGCHPAYVAMLEGAMGPGYVHRPSPLLLLELERAIGKHAGGRLWRAAGYTTRQIAYLRRHPAQYRETKRASRRGSA